MIVLRGIIIETMKFHIIIIFILFSSLKSFATDYYVSVSGSDRNAGTKPNKPFRTLQYAVDKMQAGDVCYVMEGIYRETVTFHQSGKPEQPLLITNYQGQKVVVSGLDLVTGWKKNDDGTWQTKVDWNLGLGKNQLFCNDEVMIEARFPNVPAQSLELPVGGLSKLQPTFTHFSLTDADHVASESIKIFPKDAWKGAIYYGFHNSGWSAQTAIVTQSDSSTLSLSEKTKNWWFYPRKSIKEEEGKGMLVGVKAALDRPHEWVLDGSKILFIPPLGINPEKVTEFKRRQIAFDFSNQSHITVKGIDIKAASVLMNNAAYCTIDSSKMSYISHYTIVTDGGGGLGGVAAEKPEKGLYISGDHNRILNSEISFSAGAGVYLYGHSHTIHNNNINETGYAGSYSSGIFIRGANELYSGNHIISYNTISNTGRFCLWFAGDRETKTGDPIALAGSLITHNHIYNGMIQARDGGLLSSFSVNVGAYGKPTEFSYNVVHDCYDIMVIKYKWKLGLVYWDNNTQNLVNHHNLIWSKPGTVDIPYLFNAPAVNVTWEANNRYLKNYEGSVQTLKTTDFPDDKPFEFGHKISNPAVPAWGNKVVYKKEMNKKLVESATGRMEKISFYSSVKSLVLRFSLDDVKINKWLIKSFGNKVVNPTKGYTYYNVGNNKEDIERSSTKITDKHSQIKGVVDGHYIKFKKVDLGTGYQQLRFLFASDNPNAKRIDIKLDSLNGKIVHTIPLTYAGSARTYYGLEPFVEVKNALPKELNGVHDVFFHFKGGGGKEIGQFHSIFFEKYKEGITLSANESVLEIRLDSPTGELLGLMYPVNTSGSIKENIIPIDGRSLTGTHDVYFVYKTTGDSPILLESFSLQN
jgi:Carbohydrate binding module (family 6)